MLGMYDKAYAKLMTANLRLMKKLGQAMTSASEGFDFDVLVVSYGFGGSVTALRLTRRATASAFSKRARGLKDSSSPETSFVPRSSYSVPKIGCYGIQRIDALKDCSIVSGAG